MSSLLKPSFIFLWDAANLEGLPKPMPFQNDYYNFSGYLNLGIEYTDTSYVSYYLLDIEILTRKIIQTNANFPQ